MFKTMTFAIRYFLIGKIQVVKDSKRKIFGWISKQKNMY